MTVAAPPPYPSAEEVPRYEHAGRASSDFSLDRKDGKHVVSDDDDREEEEAPKQTVPGGGIILDRLKSEKLGSVIVDTSTGCALYTIAAFNRFSTYRGTEASFRHGDDPATDPYAMIEPLNAVTLAPVPGCNPSGTVTNDSKFLYSGRAFLGTPKHFEVDGVEYTLKIKPATKIKFDLVPRDSPKSAPLATFQARSIIVHPHAVSHSPASAKGKAAGSQPPPHSLLLDGQPTRLLDLALVAEAIYKANLGQSGVTTAVPADSAPSTAASRSNATSAASAGAIAFATWG